MDTRERRLQENEQAFQTANERFRDALDGTVAEGQLVPFLCECLDEVCLERLELSLDEYEDIRSDPSHFIIVHGHPRLDGEEVIGGNDRYQLVQKGAS